jgi:hypothetical protein
MTMAKIVMKILMTASNNDWRNVNINEIQWPENENRKTNQWPIMWRRRQ